jgi:hypothetical protein
MVMPSWVERSGSIHGCGISICKQKPPPRVCGSRIFVSFLMRPDSILITYFQFNIKRVKIEYPVG